MLKEHKEVIDNMVAAANNLSYEMDQAVEIYEEGPDYVRVRLYPTDEDEDIAMEDSVTAKVRIMEPYHGFEMMELTLDGEESKDGTPNVRYLDARGHHLVAVMYS